MRSYDPQRGGDALQEAAAAPPPGEEKQKDRTDQAGGPKDKKDFSKLCPWKNLL